MDTLAAATVDEKLREIFPEDDVLLKVRQDSHAVGLPIIEVSAQQGKLLELLVRTAGAKHVLEVGTLGGYSTICLARGLPKDGNLVTLEYEFDHAKVAAENIELAGLTDKVRILIGDAAKTLPQLFDRVKHRVQEHFDFVFIDADKDNNQLYTDWAIELTRPGATILVDNVIRDGRVLQVANKLEYIEYLGANPYLDVTVTQTIGEKGWDGFVLARRI